MNLARLIEADLLGGEDRESEELINQVFGAMQAAHDSGEVSTVTADSADRFYHRTQTYAKSKRPIEVRRMGRTKRWKTRPNDFRIPVKFGMYDSFYIDNSNAHEWSTRPDPENTP